MGENNNGATARLDESTYQLLLKVKGKTKIPIKWLIHDAVMDKYSEEG